jgi:hypothetical protein
MCFPHSLRDSAVQYHPKKTNAEAALAKTRADREYLCNCGFTFCTINTLHRFTAKRFAQQAMRQNATAL